MNLGAFLQADKKGRNKQNDIETNGRYNTFQTNEARSIES